MRTHCRRLFAVLGIIAGAQFAHADSPSVTAVLNRSEAALGETVRLEIRVIGARGADAPEEIMVDGLEIRRTGTSQRIEMNNLSLTSSVVYDYTVMPLKAGTFTIPPQTIRIGNNSVRTPALTLNVADSSGRSSGARPGRDTQAAGANNLVFAELIVPSKTAYVGEIVPVQIRMGFDPRVRPRLIEPPEITGQGFTAQKLQQAGENTETISGRLYEVVTYKTAIAAARAGKFEIGPIKAKAQVVIPRRQSAPRSRPRSPFDLFDQDDPFSDPFFSNPFSQVGERREVEIKSEPVALEVKPLPPNAPTSFSGAIGNFTMTTDAKPKSVQVGDPITVTNTISGRGNFDRVNAPVIEDERGWHKYPPSSKFKQDDEVGLSGTKTFEMVLSPNEKKPGLPLLALIGIASWKVRRARIDNREAQRVAGLQHEATDLMHKLHRNDVSPREYYAEASRVVRVKTALASSNRPIDPNMVDVDTAAEAFKLNSDSRDRLRRLFEQSDEWQYSGAHNGPGRVSPESRREVLELIENLK